VFTLCSSIFLQSYPNRKYVYVATFCNIQLMEWSSRWSKYVDRMVTKHLTHIKCLWHLACVQNYITRLCERIIHLVFIEATHICNHHKICDIQLPPHCRASCWCYFDICLRIQNTQTYTVIPWFHTLCSFHATQSLSSIEQFVDKYQWNKYTSHSKKEIEYGWSKMKTKRHTMTMKLALCFSYYFLN